LPDAVDEEAEQLASLPERATSSLTPRRRGLKSRKMRSTMAPVSRMTANAAADCARIDSLVLPPRAMRLAISDG